ncbi:hypothetical protein F5Y15DRAFT_136 [Xylariaceae sp. FL0016]|nr:hypothetical protein F5Y15DRAFT_136 [Xylariaceae sp. FL0016]
MVRDSRDTPKPTLSDIEEGSQFHLPSTFSPWRTDEQAGSPSDPGIMNDTIMSPKSPHRVSEDVFSPDSIKTVSPLSPKPQAAQRTFTAPEVVISAPSAEDISSIPRASTAGTVARKTRFHEMLSRSISSSVREKGPSASVVSCGEVTHGMEESRLGGQSAAESYSMNFIETPQPSPGWRSSEESEVADDLAIRYAQPPLDCHSRRDVHIRKSSYIYVCLILLSIYSTFLSGLWLFVSIYQPRYGQGISTASGSKLQPSTATLLCTLMARSIEISFVTVFVAVLGQVLTRRAFSRSAKGITVAEMTMRNWVIQPGSILTKWENIPSAGGSILGCLALTATLVALLYTTASDAMVSPKLAMDSWKTTYLKGLVKASYSNPYYVKDSCQTPIDPNLDPDNSAFSCLDVQHSGQSYHDMITFMKEWQTIHNNSNSNLDTIDVRPTAKHNLYDNTTMESSWIEADSSNTPALFDTYSRIINNVTLAMPHPGVYEAATNPKNGIMQPDDLQGLGEYAVRAGVVSPAVNVMCVNANADELAPLIYTEWPNARTEDTEIPGQKIGVDDWYTDVPVESDSEWLNQTVVDDIFLWGEKYGRRPPVFQLYPIPYNMITNTTVISSDSLYILTNGNLSDYTLCELRSWVTAECSTEFDISGLSGGSMRAHCEDPLDKYAYKYVDPEGAALTPYYSGDWKNLAAEWTTAINLNAGVQNSNASNARILNNLVLSEPKLNPLLPSLAEALAVLASSTLVTGSLATTYKSTWTHGDEMELNPGVYEAFKAEVKTQQYASSHTEDWQAIFYPVLGLVFLLNFLCFAYLVFGDDGIRFGKGGCFNARGSPKAQGRQRSHSTDSADSVKGSHAGGLVTDYTEPQNLFAMAINSPPSRSLAGSCGHGPDHLEIRIPWRVAYSEAANHYFFEEARDQFAGKNAGISRRAFTSGTDLLAESGGRRGDFGKSYKRLSTSRTWL